MDVAPIKHALPDRARLHDGRVVYMRPLPPRDIEGAELEARAECQLHGAPCEGIAFDRELEGRLLAASLRWSLLEVFGAFTPGELEALVTRLAACQGRACPESVSKLRGWLRRRVNDDAAVMLEACRAYEAESAAEFYGRPGADLTEGQTAYWRVLRAAFEEYHIPDASGRCKTPTRSWLASEEN